MKRLKAANIEPVMVTNRNPYLFTNVDEIGPFFGLNEIRNFIKSIVEFVVPLIYELYITYTQCHARHQTQYPRGVAFTFIEFIQQLNIQNAEGIHQTIRFKRDKSSLLHTMH